MVKVITSFYEGTLCCVRAYGGGWLTLVIPSEGRKMEGGLRYDD
jgi:hypothetical protein